ncbi:MAG: hypothetical protein AABW68_01250 [archaeon]
MTRKVRFGPRIVLHQIGSVPIGEKEKQLFAEELNKIRDARKKLEENKPSGFETKRDRLLAQARVLSISRRLGAEQGGRKPTVYQVLGIVARQHGLDSPELSKTIRVMNTIGKQNRRNGKESPWEGDVGSSYMTLKKIGGRPMVALIEEILRTSPAEMNSMEVANRIGVPFRKEVVWQNRINNSLQLLDSAGYVRKMLPMDTGLGGQLSVWVHGTKRNPAILYPNLKIDILNTLHLQGSQPRARLYAPDPSRRSLGNPNAKFTYLAVHTQLKKLEKAGLVTTINVKMESSKSQESKVVSLTPYGKKLMDRYRESGRLPEILRKLLVGEKEKQDTQ